MALRVHGAAAAALLCVFSLNAWGQSNNGLISEIQAKRNGLQRVWFTQVRLDSARGHVVGVFQQLSSIHATTIHEVHFKGGKFRFTAEQTDRFGDAIGPEGAKKLARERSILLQRQGFKPKLKTITLPEITLYATTNRGVVHAIDGESGRTKWSTIVGERDHPTLAPAANDKYVAVVNGSWVYMLDRNDGRQLWRRSLVGAPGAGPAMSESLVFVPIANGKIQSYRLDDYKFTPGIYQSIGRAFVQPIVTPRSVVWPTDRGHMYVGPNTRKGIRYRVEARDTITTQAAFLPPSTLFAVSVDGYVYSFHESNGAMIWTRSLGEDITEPPVVLDKHVYVITGKGNLYALSVDSGEPIWVTPLIRSYLSASRDRLYVVGKSGRMTLIDRKTGATLSSLPTEELDLKMLNIQTDRIFIGTRKGLIQCVREIGNEYPVVHFQEADPAAKDGGKPGDAKAGAAKQPDAAADGAGLFDK